jgi:NAD(P)-dependent dehydrogenase (short-subunit alcohol dehydrogenase family)
MTDNAVMDAGRLFRLDGRVAMITGASSGLGERFAEVAAAKGPRWCWWHGVRSASKHSRPGSCLAAMDNRPTSTALSYSSPPTQAAISRASRLLSKGVVSSGVCRPSPGIDARAGA